MIRPQGSRYPIDAGGGYRLNKAHYFARGLLFWYPGSGLSGHIALNSNGQHVFRDAGPYGYHLTTQGATALSPQLRREPMGAVSARVQNSGDSGLILPDVSAELTASTEATLSIWIKNVSSNSFFVWSGATAATDSHYPFVGDDLYLSNFLAARIGPLTNSAFGSSGRNSWHHLCITSQPGAGNWKLYQNGILRHTSTGDSVPDWGDRILLGKGQKGTSSTDATGGASYNGYFFSPALHKRALSAREVYGLWHPSTRWAMFDEPQVYPYPELVVSTGLSVSDYLEDEIIKHAFRTGSWTKPTTLYAALFTSDPAEDASGTEVSGGAYARVAITVGDAQWAAIANGLSDNAAAITFPAASGANWGTVTHCALFDASTGGNMYFYGPLTSPIVVNSGDAATHFPIGNFNITLTHTT